MKQEDIDKIKSSYDKTGEFKLNDRYSGEQELVYTKDGDKYHWLVLEQKGENGLEVRQTDGQGRIISRDSYESVQNIVICTGVERLNAEGKEMMSFSAYEINLINQFGENNREGTLANLKEIKSGITDIVTKKIVENFIHKLSRLSDKSYEDMRSQGYCSESDNFETPETIKTDKSEKSNANELKARQPMFGKVR